MVVHLVPSPSLTRCRERMYPSTILFKSQRSRLKENGVGKAHPHPSPFDGGFPLNKSFYIKSDVKIKPLTLLGCSPLAFSNKRGRASDPCVCVQSTPHHCPNNIPFWGWFQQSHPTFTNGPTIQKERINLIFLPHLPSHTPYTQLGWHWGYFDLYIFSPINPRFTLHLIKG